MKHEEKLSCQHFWEIGSPNGPTNRGKCKYCGEVREFTNTGVIPREAIIQSRSKMKDGTTISR